MAKAGVLRLAKDFQNMAGSAGSTIVRKGTSPLSVAGLGGAGAYSYKQYTDVEEEAHRTERYTRYQERLGEIEDMHAKGEITYAQMEEMKAEAQQAFYSSNDGDSNSRGLSFTDLIAQMGSIQLLAVSGVAALVVYFVLRPVAIRIAAESPSIEEILG